MLADPAHEDEWKDPLTILRRDALTLAELPDAVLNRPPA